ncbi:MAG: ABC transporter substrate-binding protein [Anaerolineae bacterium]|nr:ABC transporter substrate-binding protein [Anaerolineae bacterium]
MRKIIILTMLSIFTMLIAACGSPAAPETTEESSEAATPAEAKEPAEGEEAAEAEEPAEAEDVADSTTPPEDPIDVTIAVGTYVLNANYYWLMMPQALGYWEDMGYNVTVEGVGSSTDVLQQIVGGNADMGQMGASVVVQANVKEDIPMRIVHETGIVDWQLAVPADSDIQEPADFTGKTIGVFNMTSSGIPLLESYLRENGVDVQSDANMIAIGFGPQASEALNSGDADAVMLWGAAIAQLENLGHEFRYFRSDQWDQMPDFSLAVAQDYFDENRQVVVDVVKGMNMAIVFAGESPECVVKLQWENWPDTKPTDVDQGTAQAWDMHIVSSHYDVAAQGAYQLHGSDLWGQATVEEFDLMQNFLVENNLLESTIDPSTFIINDSSFWDEINDFDVEAIKKQAQEMDCSN